MAYFSSNYWASNYWASDYWHPAGGIPVPTPPPPVAVDTSLREGVGSRGGFLTPTQFGNYIYWGSDPVDGCTYYYTDYAHPEDGSMYPNFKERKRRKKEEEELAELIELGELEELMEILS
jgi:hypothetical protein